MEGHWKPNNRNVLQRNLDMLRFRPARMRGFLEKIQKPGPVMISIERIAVKQRNVSNEKDRD